MMSTLESRNAQAGRGASQEPVALLRNDKPLKGWVKRECEPNVLMSSLVITQRRAGFPANAHADSRDQLVWYVTRHSSAEIGG